MPCLNPPESPPPPVPHLKDSHLYKHSPRPRKNANLTCPLSSDPFADFDSDNTHSATTTLERARESTYSRWQQRRLEAEFGSCEDAYRPSGVGDRQTLLSPMSTRRRGAVSSESPVSPTLPTAPPIPRNDEYISRKYRSGKANKTLTSDASPEEKKSYRRSSFYSFWDDVLGARRATLSARTYNGL